MALLAIRSPRDLPWKKKLRCATGRIFGALRPGLARKVGADPFNPQWGKAAKLVRNGLFHQALATGDHASLKRFLVEYWGSDEGRAFHDNFRARFETHFLGHASRSIDDFEEHLRSAGPAIDRVVEVGCGSGQVMGCLADRFPKFASFTGLDLSDKQIEENRRTFAERRELEFVTADVCDWIPAHGEAGTLVLTNGGVLEYIDQPALEGLLCCISDKMAPASLIVAETVANDHDLNAELGSLVYGREMSFSHNYPHLIQSAGFSIRFQEEWVADDDCRWIYIHAHTCATAGGKPIHDNAGSPAPSSEVSPTGGAA